jgi:hypothetical protein
VPLGSVGENFVVNFPRLQFQAQQASMNLLIKSGQLSHFWTRNLLKKRRVLTEEKLGEIRARLEHTRQKSLRRLVQETSIEIVSSQIDEAVNFIQLKWYRQCVCVCVCVCVHRDIIFSILKGKFILLFFMERHLTRIGKIM